VTFQKLNFYLDFQVLQGQSLSKVEITYWFPQFPTQKANPNSSSGKLFWALESCFAFNKKF
jgi:hypothetical protein